MWNQVEDLAALYSHVPMATAILPTLLFTVIIFWLPGGKREKINWKKKVEINEKLGTWCEEACGVGWTQQDNVHLFVYYTHTHTKMHLKQSVNLQKKLHFLCFFWLFWRQCKLFHARLQLIVLLQVVPPTLAFLKGCFYRLQPKNTRNKKKQQERLCTLMWPLEMWSRGSQLRLEASLFPVTAEASSLQMNGSVSVQDDLCRCLRLIKPSGTGALYIVDGVNVLFKYTQWCRH